MNHPVPYGLLVTVSIRREDDSAFVDVHAPMYLNKEWTMRHSYHSPHFSDSAILSDHNFVTTLINHYGV